MVVEVALNMLASLSRCWHSTMSVVHSGEKISAYKIGLSVLPMIACGKQCLTNHVQMHALSTLVG